MATLTNFDLGNAIDSFAMSSDIARMIAKELLPPAAADFKQMIIGAAESEFSSSQGSILEHIRNIGVGGIEETAGGFTIGLSLGGGLARPSLSPFSGGVSDIVGLFISGWRITKRRPFGMWNGRMVGARPFWPGMGFLSSAVDEFNAKYAGMGITASAGY